MIIHYSRGKNTYDNRPEQRQASNFDDFSEAVLADRSSKKGETYICAPMALGQHNDTTKYHEIATWRSKSLVQPRAFLPFDCDGFDCPETFHKLLTSLEKYKGFAYTTASHTSEAPRCRFVLSLTRETTREEGNALSEAIQHIIDREIDIGLITWDSSVYKGEQPFYTPLHGVKSFRFNGESIDVDVVLNEVSITTDTENTLDTPADDPVLQRLRELGHIKYEMAPGKYAVQCPCSAEHTSKSAETSTVYYLPHFNGYKNSNFHCLHAHCKNRPQGEFLRALGLYPQEQRIIELSKMPEIEYERIRREEAKTLGMRASVLDKVVEGNRNEGNNSHASFKSVELWPETVDGTLLLKSITTTIQRFVICDEEIAVAAGLWSIATWLLESLNVTPIFLINAPEKACGKTQLLTVIGKLVKAPVQTAGISSSVLFRLIEKYQPTLLIDEIETVLTAEAEDLRGLLNSGHTRDSAYIWRCVGDDHEPIQFKVFGFKALAGINAVRLAETITSRSIIATLRRKAAHESSERLRYVEPNLFENIASQIARWAQDSASTIKSSRPYLPEALDDREQDNWEPLLAIAELIGGEWPRLARSAALKLRSGEQALSIGSELLEDIREIFESKGSDRIGTADLIKILCQDEEKPWLTYNKGNPIRPRQVANKLKAYGIESKNLRIGGSVVKGFESKQFEEAFASYLSHPLKEFSTTLQMNTNAAHSVAESVCV